MSNEEIINALKTIKEICTKNICSECPFLNIDTDICTFSKIDPCNWIINEEKQIWRAFK